MSGVEISVLVALFLALVVVAALYVRRSVLVRSGAIHLCLRDRIDHRGRGWSLGYAKFDGESLLGYRTFSLKLTPSRRYDRSDLVIGNRRDPVGSERDLLPAGSVIFRCQVAGRTMELATSPDAATGLLAWLEAVPPSNHSTGRLGRAG